MLINLDSLVALYNIKFNGILHVGAHKCEEIKYYGSFSNSLKYSSLSFS